MRRGWWAAVVLWSVAAHGLPVEEQTPDAGAVPSAAPVPNACLKVLPEDSVLSEVFNEARFSVKGAPYGIDEVHFSGLRALSEAKLWSLLGGRPNSRLSWEQGAALVARLVESGLFARVVPNLDARPAGEGMQGVLEVRLEEHPLVQRVELEGAVETDRETLLESLFVAPSERAFRKSREAEQRDCEDEDDDDEAEDEDEDEDEDERVEVTISKTTACPAPVPNPEWLAHSDGKRFVPGIAWKGLSQGVQRVMRHLVDEGYLLARVDAQLKPDGVLVLRVDEGRLERFEVVGLHPSLSARVEKGLKLKEGEILLRSDVDASLNRLQEELPFLRRARSRAFKRGVPQVKEERLPDGTVTYAFVPALNPVPSARKKRTLHLVWRDQDHEEEDSVDLPSWDWNHDDDGDYLEVSGRTLRVHLRVARFSGHFNAVELLKHTQVTSFAPGLWGTLRFQDPADRVRVALDLGANVNTGRSGNELFDVLVGGRLAFPAIKLAELGVQYHALTDTQDRWRVAPIDSYLQSLLFNRPNAEYFRRSGVTAFLSSQPLAGFVLGAEYRVDNYASLASLPKVFTVFNRNEPAYPNPAIDDGRMESVLLRLDWTNRARSPYDVNADRRDPELPLYGPVFDDRFTIRSSNTVEIAGPMLAAGNFRFVRLISLNSIYLPMGRRTGFTFHLRGGGGNGVPLQKQEALGGWGTLRGYDFKEFRGDFSLLGSAEYRWRVFSLFVDVGSVRAEGEWSRAKVGFGGGLNFGDQFHVNVAWRTDALARPAPAVMAFFRRTF